MKGKFPELKSRLGKSTLTIGEILPGYNTKTNGSNRRYDS